jgi:hypothetical protein
MNKECVLHSGAEACWTIHYFILKKHKGFRDHLLLGNPLNKVTPKNLLWKQDVGPVSRWNCWQSERKEGESGWEEEKVDECT